MIRLYRKITILLILKTNLSLKMSYVNSLHAMIKMTISHLSELSTVDFDIVRLLN